MKIDTSGLSCPEPVLRTKKAIKSKPASIEVVVDNNTAMQNVKRFLENSGYQVSLDDLLVKGTK
ncbi:hypothetical protein EZV73_20335 [Acidaminobacter sp. JC074]|uniref:sulfurtransferase TusA family protein n=1 Tax=Acidaminobacter sp. JC074 TaxID=2530199 RepID=UPI001F1165D8|nr:sulfurtransferase TusA family protein [Acidaminobacter sp. JC074]MCH4889940.1 hypothetical protein [Acidaminobacter sp. JC074]